MASTNLTGKRRRVENAASTLSKPFKSPLRKPAQASEAAPIMPKKEVEEQKQSESTPLRSKETSKVHGEEDHPAPTFTPTSTTTSISTTNQTRKRKNPSLSTTTPTKRHPLHKQDPILTDLQKHQRSLQSRLSTLRGQLDTATQALKIESSPRDAELEDLIVKWRGVSQEAADEVFAGAQERVARMGGMRAWREGMRSRDVERERMWEREEVEGWFGGSEGDDDGDGDYDNDEEKAERKREEVLEELGVAKEREKEECGEKEGEKGDEDEEFTMGVMLKTLNIDPRIIGFDIAGQKWIKD